MGIVQGELINNSRAPAPCAGDFWGAGGRSKLSADPERHAAPDAIRPRPEVAALRDPFPSRDPVQYERGASLMVQTALTDGSAAMDAADYNLGVRAGHISCRVSVPMHSARCEMVTPGCRRDLQDDGAARRLQRRRDTDRQTRDSAVSQTPQRLRALPPCGSSTKA
jgi:hypothetical protein